MSNNKEPKSVKYYISKLGCRVKDKVTGIEGVITSVSFDLYGCIQAVVTYTKDNTIESYWMDFNRLSFLSTEKAMEAPDFESKREYIDAEFGSAEKPIP